jgi:drug/metabolite transporter (DMT)-like permease
MGKKTVPSGVASLLVATEPLIIAVFEPVITRGNRIGRRTILGMLTGMAGIAFLVLPKGFNFENANLTGTLVILLCASSWSIGAIYSRIANIPRSPFITGGMQLISGGVLLILMSFILNEWSGFSFQQVTARSWSGLAYLVFFGSIITFSAYTWLLSITTATRISTHNFINPVIAVIVGWAFGNEALTSEILFYRETPLDYILLQFSLLVCRW